MTTRRRRESEEGGSMNSSQEYQEMPSAESMENMMLVDRSENGEEGEEEEEEENGLGRIRSVTDSLQQTITEAQRYANITAHVLALLTVMVVCWWISKLGGLSWQAGKSKQVFNWHPLLMVTAFSFMTVSSLSFRFPWKYSDRNTTKLVHAICWSVAALSALVGLIAVFRSHNDPVSGYIANMYSLHSWVGGLVIVLYLAQFLVGVRAFGGPLATPNISQPWRALLLRFHVVLGPLIYFLTGVTILLGIQEKEGFVGCAYHVDSADLFPIQHLGKIPSACLVSHLLGFLVTLTLIFSGVALADFRTLS